jgi:photosystem II stability/assembly factor-like uncharacterized protein
MKNALTLFAAAMLCLTTAIATTPGWTEMGPKFETSITTLLPIDDNNFIVGLDGGGLKKTTDHGDSWYKLKSGLPQMNGTYSSLTKTANGNLFLTSLSDGIFVSFNSGENWKQIQTTSAIDNIAVNQENLIYTVVSQSPLKISYSSNIGTDWNDVNTDNFMDIEVKNLWLIDDYLFIIDQNYNLHVTNNNGVQWSDIENQSQAPILKMYKGDNDKIYLISSSGVIYESANYGANWDITNNGLTTENVYNCAISGHGCVIVSAQNGVFGSSDYGQYFMLINDGLEGYDNKSLTNITCGTDGYFYAVAPDGLSIVKRATPTAVDEQEINSVSIEISPNPVSEMLNIKAVNADESINQIRLFDMHGNLVFNIANMNSASTRVDLSKLASGVYFVDVVVGEKLYCRKIVIE